MHYLSIVFILLLMQTACGGSSGAILSNDELEEAQEEQESSDSEDTSTATATDDTADDVTTETITTETFGDSDNVPVATEIDDGNITLNCTDRSGDAESDYIVVTCGSGDGAATQTYYCSSDTVTDQEDDSGLFTITTINCTVGDDGAGTIEEEETIVG